MNAASAPKRAASCTISCCMPWCVADARVLVGQHAGVDVGARELLVQLRQQLERVGESARRGAERAAKALQLRDLGEQASFAARHASSDG